MMKWNMCHSVFLARDKIRKSKMRNLFEMKKCYSHTGESVITCARSHDRIAQKWSVCMNAMELHIHKAWTKQIVQTRKRKNIVKWVSEQWICVVTWIVTIDYCYCKCTCNDFSHLLGLIYYYKIVLALKSIEQNKRKSENFEIQKKAEQELREHICVSILCFFFRFLSLHFIQK